MRLGSCALCLGPCIILFLMPRLPDETVTLLARDLGAVLDAHVPGWTSHQTHDPGLTLLELIAYLADVLVYREPSADMARRATEGIARLRALTVACDAAALERVRYFEGRLLTASDLNDDQHYHRDTLKRALLALHGDGIVKGLDVTIDGSAGGDDLDVTISAGAAITPAGELLVIDPCRRCRLRVGGDAGFVVLAYTERETHLVPVPGDATLPQASRIEEGVGVTFDPVSPPDAVAIARLIRDASGWRVDAKRPTA